MLAPLPLQQRHAGAAHRHRDVDLSVGVSAGHAGARPLQDDGGGEDQSAAVLLALLLAAGAPQQAASAQAVGLRDVAGEPGRVVREPERRTHTVRVTPVLPGCVKYSRSTAKHPFSVSDFPWNPGSQGSAGGSPCSQRVKAG